jgi:hypothetical protein
MEPNRSGIFLAMARRQTASSRVSTFICLAESGGGSL